MSAWLKSVLMVMGLGLGLTTAAWSGEYFLDASQKADLILHGRMTGQDGADYDVWVVPGYVPPLHSAGKNWKQAGKELGAYGRASHYRHLEKTSRAWIRTGGKNILRDFALKGTGTAWAEAMSAAHERVERRVFGWWFAYPWALIEASTETVLRTGVGIPAGVGAVAGAYTVVPAWYFVAPAVKSAGYAALPGTAFPVVATSWNTVIAPPLAIAGQQPAPERADGFWMKRLKDPAEDDLRARLVAWQSQWKEDAALAAQREALAANAKQHAEKINAWRAQIAAEEALRQQEERFFDAERRRVVAEQTIAQTPALRDELTAQGYTQARLQAQRPMLQELLVQQGMTTTEATRMLDILMGIDSTRPGQRRNEAEKTDPLQQIQDRL